MTILKIKLIHPSGQLLACPSLNLSPSTYYFHNDAVWSSSRKHKANVSRCSHQGSFILEAKRKTDIKLLQINAENEVMLSQENLEFEPRIYDKNHIHIWYIN